MAYIRWPKCGHRRTTTNTTKRGTCRTCAAKNLAANRIPAHPTFEFAPPPRKRYRIDPNFFRCGHPKSPENSAPTVDGYQRCLCCKQAGTRKWHHAKAAARKKLTLPMRHPNLPQIAPRPLPPVDHAGRSYPFPLKRFA